MESLNSHLQIAWCILAGIILSNVAAYFLNNKRSNVGVLILSLLLACPPALIIASLTNIKRQAIKEMTIVEEFCKNIPQFKLNISPQELESNPIGLKEKYHQYHYKYEHKDNEEYILYKNERFKLLYAKGDGDRDRFLYYRNGNRIGNTSFTKGIFVDKKNQLALFEESSASTSYELDFSGGPSGKPMILWFVSISTPDCRRPTFQSSQSLITKYRELTLEK